MTNKDENVITAYDIAEYFIRKSEFDEKHLSTVSPLKLQKLIYYAQAWHTVFNNKEKLFDDEIQAWVHGPVVPAIYHRYKHFGYNDIVKKIKEIPVSIQRNDKVLKLLDAVWAMYGELDAKSLEKLTHSEEPWQKARNGLKSYEPSKNVISIDSMHQYYKSFLNKE